MKCLVVIPDPERDGALVEVARALANGDAVAAMAVVEVPEERTLASAQAEAKTLRRALAPLERAGAQVHVAVARRGWDAVAERVRAETPDLLVVGWRRPGWVLLGTTVERVLADPPCDVAVIKGPVLRARRVLVAVRGGRYARLATRVASTFARARGARLTLLHVSAAGQGRPDDTLAQHEEDRLVTRGGDPATAIADELASHDLVVLGATGRSGEGALGPIVEATLRVARAAIVVRTRTPVAAPATTLRPALPADRAARSRALGELVDGWFAENTFTSTEFADLRQLVDAKERQGVRISVVLPTLNESATIAKVIRAIRSRLCERYPLVDELVVVDSDSRDDTRELARAEGVPVFVHRRILPECGSFVGKGEAMWKSLHVTTGDIVVWIDTDISNIHPKFVYGIVGPLLRRPEIQFVKAFYRRPLRLGSELQSAGGGRVTELMARPIINLLYPELSGMLQPLSGEQGGRRGLLEQLPFFAGYGVEMGLLIDVLRASGLSSISQVDMKQRIHRNQSLYSLSKMSFEILQVALRRADGARAALEDANASMKLIRETTDGQLQLAVEEIAPVERPPMITVDAYRSRAV